MRVLIGCEESGVATRAFRAAGHEAYSCDLLPTRGNPGHHFQMDIKKLFTQDYQWGLIILHPDCTAMAVSGNRWYGKGMPYHQKRLDAVQWSLDLWGRATRCCNHVALENRVSVLFSRLPNVSYIQPWQFGHGETKKTGFALHNLPPLTPTDIVEGREQRIWKMPPSKHRKRDRSVTFSGVAKAMADQWGSLPSV